MAYQLNYWKYSYGPHRPDDLEEIQPSKRIKRVTDIPNVLRPISAQCDVVTLDRTDRQSPISREVWVRPSKGKK